MASTHDLTSRIAAMIRAESERFQQADGTAGPDAPKWGFRVAAEALRDMADKVEKLPTEAE